MLPISDVDKFMEVKYEQSGNAVVVTGRVTGKGAGQLHLQDTSLSATL